jgi:hypothetical protein
MLFKGNKCASNFLLLSYNYALLTLVISTKKTMALTNDILVINMETRDSPYGAINIKISTSLKERLECQLEQSQNFSFTYECPGDFPRRLFKYYQSPIRVIGHRVEFGTGLKKVMDLYWLMKKAYQRENGKRKLSGIVLILPSSLIAFLKRLLMDFNVPVIFIDTVRMFRELSIDSGNFFGKLV